MKLWLQIDKYYMDKEIFLKLEDDRDKTILIEFEGVCHNAEVYLNGKKVLFRSYGYTNFYVDTKDALLYGEEKHIPVNGVGSRIVSYEPVAIEVEVRTSEAAGCRLRFLMTADNLWQRKKRLHWQQKNQKNNGDQWD